MAGTAPGSATLSQAYPAAEAETIDGAPPVGTESFFDDYRRSYGQLWDGAPLDIPLGGVDLPKQEGADRIALHQAVKERSNLVGAPHELPLDGREDVLMSLHPFERCLDRDRGLEGHRLPRSQAGALLGGEPLSLDPDNASALRGRGVALGSLGRYDEAVRDSSATLVCQLPASVQKSCGRAGTLNRRV